MKNSIIFTIIISFLSISQSACKKALNALPGQAKVEGNVIVDQKSAEVALNGVYYRLVNVSDNYTTGLPSTQWSYNHETIPSQMAGTIVYYQGASGVAENTSTSEDYEVGNIWRNSYDIINAANNVISGLESLGDSKINAEVKKQILAEAHFLRAYANYQLLSYYGEFYNVSSQFGILIRKEAVTVSNIAQKRNTVQESYDFILADVDDAIANIKNGKPNYYASTYAAMALKMRILINRGASGDYASIITLADNIINSGAYQLEANVKDIFKTKGLSSNEIILGTKAFAGQPSETEVYFYRGASQYYNTDLLLYYLQGDPRLAWMNTVVETNNTFTKYDGSQFEAHYAFRLTEIYLLKAEAIVRSAGSLASAKDILKTIEGHAGVTDFSAINNATTNDQVLMEVYKEISRNLVAEDGADWFALLRLPIATVMQIKPTIQEKFQYILPIPKDEHDKNPTIGDQNPGYGW